MTSALWRHPSAFLQWPRLCGDILLHFSNDLDFVETSFWILAMTSALWRHHFGFLQWPQLRGDIFSNLNFRLIPWPIEYLNLLEIFSILALWRYNSTPMFILAQVSAWWWCHFISLFFVDHHPIIDNITTLSSLIYRRTIYTYKDHIQLRGITIIKRNNDKITFGLKYTFGPYFCCFYSIWFLFSFCVQLGYHFPQILVNLVFFTNGVSIVNVFEQYMPRVNSWFF